MVNWDDYDDFGGKTTAKFLPTKKQPLVKQKKSERDPRNNSDLSEQDSTDQEDFASPSDQLNNHLFTELADDSKAETTGCSTTKRPINYTIMKNRGFSARKAKENRNPRLKKRRKYERAIKKLGSFKRLAKPLEGHYSGERNGIRDDVSRSRKFA